MPWIPDPAASPLTTKGDLYTHDTDDQRLPVGSDGQVLTADSAEATGMKWATPSGGGGGGGGKSYVTCPADKPPDTPHASDDEFNGTSLNTTKWT